MWQRIAALVRKEFLALFKDRRGRFVLIVLAVFGTIVVRSSE